MSEETMKAFTEEIIAVLFSLINEKGSLTKSASLNGKEVKEASLWMSLHDRSGYLKQFVKEMDLPTSTFNAIGFLLSFHQKRQINFLYVFDSSDKCLFAAQVSSKLESRNKASVGYNFL